MSLRGDSGKRENTQVIYKETEIWGKGNNRSVAEREAMKDRWR